jgi:hypothetical protein
MRAKYPVDDMYIIGGLQVFALVMYVKWARRSVTFRALLATERKKPCVRGISESISVVARRVVLIQSPT